MEFEIGDIVENRHKGNAMPQGSIKDSERTAIKGELATIINIHHSCIELKAHSDGKRLVRLVNFLTLVSKKQKELYNIY